MAMVPSRSPPNSHSLDVSSSSRDAASGKSLTFITERKSFFLPDTRQIWICPLASRAANRVPSPFIARTSTAPFSRFDPVNSRRSASSPASDHTQRRPRASPSTSRVPSGVNTAAVVPVPRLQPSTEPSTRTPDLSMRPATRVPAAVRYTTVDPSGERSGRASFAASGRVAGRALIAAPCHRPSRVRNAIAVPASETAGTAPASKPPIAAPRVRRRPSRCIDLAEPSPCTVTISVRRPARRTVPESTSLKPPSMRTPRSRSHR